MTRTRVKWTEGMQFIGTDADGRATLIAGGDQAGVRPMQMLLLALGSCSSIDILGILRKQRLDFDDFEVEVEGDRAEEYPKPYKTIQMRFLITGRNLDRAKVERAIRLSTEKYCGVHATLSGVADISWELEIREPGQTE